MTTILANTVVDPSNGQVRMILTHLPLDKMAATFADYISKCIFVNEKFCILIKTLLKLVPKGSIDNVPKGSIDNTPALVWIVAWHWIGDKPLSEPVLIQFIDAYLWY